VSCCEHRIYSPYDARHSRSSIFFTQFTIVTDCCNAGLVCRHDGDIQIQERTLYNLKHKVTSPPPFALLTAPSGSGFLSHTSSVTIPQLGASDFLALI
jgi:hypothetical protein